MRYKKRSKLIHEVLLYCAGIMYMQRSQNDTEDEGVKVLLFGEVGKDVAFGLLKQRAQLTKCGLYTSVPGLECVLHTFCVHL